MNKKLIANGFVVINSGLELNSFNSFWLVKNKIIEESELANDHIFTSSFVRLNFNDYSITINSNSTILSMDNNNDYAIKEGISRFLILLKNIKNALHFSCGINFNWSIEDLDNKEFLDLSKRLFFVNNNPLYESFDTSDSGFGAYLSKIVKESRLKLEIKPIHDFSDKASLNFNFNFHKELNDILSTDELESYLNDWKIYQSESESLISKIV